MRKNYKYLIPPRVAEKLNIYYEVCAHRFSFPIYDWSCHSLTNPHPPFDLTISL